MDILIKKDMEELVFEICSSILMSIHSDRSKLFLPVMASKPF